MSSPIADHLFDSSPPVSGYWADDESSQAKPFAAVMNFFVNPKFLISGVVEMSDLNNDDRGDYIALRDVILPSIAAKLDLICSLRSMRRSVKDRGARFVDGTFAAVRWNNHGPCEAARLVLKRLSTVFAVFSAVIGVDYQPLAAPCAHAVQANHAEGGIVYPCNTVRRTLRIFRTLDRYIREYIEERPEVRTVFFGNAAQTADVVMEHLLTLLAIAAQHHCREDSVFWMGQYDYTSVAIALADSEDDVKFVQNDEDERYRAIFKAVDAQFARINEHEAQLRARFIKPWGLDWHRSVCERGDSVMVARSVVQKDEDERRAAAIKIATKLFALTVLIKEHVAQRSPSVSGSRGVSDD